MKTTSKTKPMIPPLSERSRVFPSGVNAAAALKLPPEVIKLARIRGVPCFHASNRVHEGPLVEFILEWLVELYTPLPDEIRESIEFDYTLAEVLEAGPIYETTFSNNQFQVMRLLWGDKSAIKARDKRLKELRKVAIVGVSALFEFRIATESKEVSPYAHASLSSLDEWDLTHDPFASIGADKLSFWAVSEKSVDLKRNEIFEWNMEWVPIDHTNNFPPCLIKPGGNMRGSMPPTRKPELIDWVGLLGE
jgi:hypothetical protein